MSDREPNIWDFLAAVGTIGKIVQAVRGHGVFCNCQECAPINAGTIVGFLGSLLS